MTEWTGKAQTKVMLCSCPSHVESRSITSADEMRMAEAGEARIARANEHLPTIALVTALREKAMVEFDARGPLDPRGAAIWDVAAWIEEEWKP